MTKYRIKIKNFSWELEKNDKTGYTKLYLVSEDRRMQLHGVDVDSCLQYIYRYTRCTVPISRKDLIEIRQDEI